MNSNGQFEDGHKKLGGRKIGSKNKATLLGKQEIENYFEEGGYKMLFAEINQLEGYTKVQALLKLVSFIVPKPKAISHTIEGGNNTQGISPIHWLEDRTLEEIDADIARLKAINDKQWPDYTKE